MRGGMRAPSPDSAAGEAPDVRLSNPGVGTQIFKAVTTGAAALMYMHIPAEVTL